MAVMNRKEVVVSKTGHPKRTEYEIFMVVEEGEHGWLLDISQNINCMQNNILFCIWKCQCCK